MFLKEYSNIKILCVEDEHDIRKNQVDYLKRLFSHVYEASNAKEAIHIIEEKKPQLLITDIEMSDISGLELVRNIRKNNKQIKIIVLSAYSNKEYLMDAIDLGLFKYLIKPIDHETFYPLLTSCAAEIFEESKPFIKITESCTFDTINSEVLFNKNTHILSKYEADFLALLYENKNLLVRYEQIQDRVWIDNIMSDNSLRTLVKSLRKKLPDNTIINLSKQGYKLNLDKS